jgi:hypothetical protein
MEKMAKVKLVLQAFKALKASKENKAQLEHMV